VTIFGNARARRAVCWLALLGLAAWALAAPFTRLHPAFLLGVVALVAPQIVRLWRLASAAVTDAFPAQAALKDVLHRLIWRGATLLGVALVVQSLLTSTP